MSARSALSRAAGALVAAALMAAATGGAALYAAPARGEPAACGAGFVLPSRPQMTGSASVERVDISADEASLSEGEVSVLEGNVQVRRGPLQLSADRIEYDRANETARARGALQLWDEGMFVSGGSADMDFGTEVTGLEDVRYMIESSRAQGGAARVEVHGDHTLIATDASYSTCDPTDPAWTLYASEIELDRVNDVGEARHVRIELGSVPVLYTPYLTFPLSDKRKSGLLPPRGRVSNFTGLEYTQPYYFNIAPDRDATVAARAMTQRGVQLQGEFRYLEDWGEGTLASEFLPHDRKYGDQRSAVKFLHKGELTKRLEAEVDFNWVSDDDYLEDLGTNLAVSGRRNLEKRGDLLYRGRGWRGLARVQGFQTIDSTIDSEDRPYQRLPQLLLTTELRERNRQLNFGGTAEFVNFDRSSGVTSQRVDLMPWASFPMRTAGSYVVPRVDLRFTQYQLDGEDPGVDDSPSRFLPIFGVNSGLIFERDVEVGSRGMIQTLEPQLQYLFIPYDDQDDIPVFDTGDYTFNYAQLFRRDRFNGADRVGDANQFSLALTSRLLTLGGREFLSASIGQIRYLRDRKVTLPGQVRQTTDSSDIVTEVSANLDDVWRFQHGLHWDPHASRTDQNVFSVRYQPDKRRVVNASYRFLRKDEFTDDESSIEQVDLSFAWPVNSDLSLVGRFNYALNDSNVLESFAGLEYESCCWAMRTVFRRYLAGDDGKHDNAVFLQLELKGLGGVGSSTVDFLERSIPGYENNF